MINFEARTICRVTVSRIESSSRGRPVASFSGSDRYCSLLVPLGPEHAAGVNASMSCMAVVMRS
jgi:hypothetical protein